MLPVNMIGSLALATQLTFFVNQELNSTSKKKIFYEKKKSRLGVDNFIKQFEEGNLEDPVAFSKHRTEGSTALYDLAFSNEESDLEIVKASYGTWFADLSAQDEDGWTALHIAAALGHKEMVEQLILVANSISRTISGGLKTIANIAFARSLEPPVEYDINAQTLENQNALGLALMYDHNEVVDLLLKANIQVALDHLLYAAKNFIKAKKEISLNDHKVDLCKENLRKIFKALKKLEAKHEYKVLSSLDEGYSAHGSGSELYRKATELFLLYSIVNLDLDLLTVFLEEEPSFYTSNEMLEIKSLINLGTNAEAASIVFRELRKKNPVISNHKICHAFVEADQEYINAQYLLGLCYENGQGVVQDHEKSAKYYQFAADRGFASAQYSLGNCYYHGQGIPQNYNKAVKYYQLAANQGCANAQNSLAGCYKHGSGLDQDDRKSAEYYQLAADQGILIACHNIGVCYELGLGVAQDYTKAIAYYQMAANKGYVNTQTEGKILKEAATFSSNIATIRSALINGDEVLLETLLNNGADAHIVLADGSNLLHLLSRSPNYTLKMFRLLLDHGAEINKTDDSGFTSLFLLINNISTDVKNSITNQCLRELLYRGADSNISCDITIQLENKKEILRNISPLCFAAYLGNFEACKVLIEWGAIVQYYTFDNNTPLSFAAYNGDLALIKYLLQSGAQLYDLQEKIDKASYPFWDIVEPYIKKNKTEIIDFLKSYSCISRDLKVYTIDRDLKHEMCSTFLYAAKIGDKSTLAQMLEHGADLAWADEKGNAALHFAVLNNKINCALYLLQYGIDINKKNKDGDSPLMLAVTIDNIDMTQLLLDHGPELDQENLAGIRPLHCAVQINSLDIVELLLLRGADLEAVDKDGRTALMLACLAGNIDLVKFLLLEAGAQFDLIDKAGKTELDHAFDSNNYELVKYLLEAGCSVSRTGDQESYLHEAVRLGNIQLVQLLLPYIYINELNNEGRTPLYLAVDLGTEDIAKILLSVSGIEWEEAYSLAQKKNPSMVHVFNNHLIVIDKEPELKAPIILMFRRETLKDFSEPVEYVDDMDYIHFSSLASK